ncbi:MAG: hypothetical protein AB1578_22215, partial [Thermodesulfobacteriota bacterium]
MCPARLFLLFPVVLVLAAVPAAAARDPVRLFMPDGQLQSHPVRVFVTEDLSHADEPALILHGSHAVTRVLEGEERARKPRLLARNHLWVQEEAGQQVVYRGTLLVFDLRDYPIPLYKAAVRVMPALEWRQGSLVGREPAVALGDREVYLGNIVGAVGWTAVLVLALLGGIGLACRRAGGRALSALLGPDGKPSLSRTQVAAWTVATGSMLSVFGLIRLEPPQIPASLVALMGLSLATGGINYFRVRQRHQEALAAGRAVQRAPAPGGAHELSELVRD